jgi:hypothetical protein
MELRELRFWVVEAMRANDRREASMADAVRFAQHADVRDYERYVRGLRARAEAQGQEADQGYREKWERLKAIGRG